MTIQPIRVLYVIGSLDPRTGGPPSSAPNVWVAARRAGLEVTAAVVATPAVGSGEQAIRDRIAREGITIHSFAPLRTTGVSIRWGVSLRLAWWLIRSAARFDIIHAHGAWMFSTLAALIASKLAHKLFVLTPHESMTRRDVVEGASPLKIWIKRAVKRLLTRYTDFVVYASQIERRDSAEPSERGRHEVIYHPVVDALTALISPRAEAPAPDPINLGFLGRFDVKKNIELLLDVVAALHRSKLHVAGAGTPHYEQELRARADRLGITSRVRWLGFISAEMRPQFFAGIDVLVMPSAYEGFGMVAAEALANAVPVIVTDSSGIAELVAKYDCGQVVPADRDVLREAIDALAGDASRLARCSANAVAMCRAEMVTADYGRRLARMYQDITTDAGAGARPGNPGT